MKTCKICVTIKTDNEFYLSNKSSCKQCVKERARKYRSDNLEKVMEYDRNRPNKKDRADKHKERQRRIKEQDPSWIPRELRQKKTDAEIKEYKAKYYQANKDRLMKKSKAWAENNIESARRYSREWAERNRESLNKNTEVWRKKNIEKILAHDKVKYAIRKKKLNRPDNCEHCNKKTSLHGHHHDYSKPLDVTWLCPVCHSAEHKRINALNRGRP